MRSLILQSVSAAYFFNIVLILIDIPFGMSISRRVRKIVHNYANFSSSVYIPKPILERLGNPDRLKFVISGDDIMVRRPDQ